jgi:hypothetical protein
MGTFGIGKCSVRKSEEEKAVRVEGDVLIGGREAMRAVGLLYADEKT